MLSDGDNRAAGMAADSEVEACVLDIVAETCGLERADVSPDMAVAVILDSLTLAAVVVRTEAAFGIGFSTEETLAMLAARDLSELCRLVSGKIGRVHESR